MNIKFINFKITAQAPAQEPAAVAAVLVMVAPAPVSRGIKLKSHTNSFCCMKVEKVI